MPQPKLTFTGLTFILPEAILLLLLVLPAFENANAAKNVIITNNAVIDALITALNSIPSASNIKIFGTTSTLTSTVLNDLSKLKYDKINVSKTPTLENSLKIFRCFMEYWKALTQGVEQKVDDLNVANKLIFNCGALLDLALSFFTDSTFVKPSTVDILSFSLKDCDAVEVQSQATMCVLCLVQGIKLIFSYRNFPGYKFKF
jgi:hypothetical protein